LIITMFYVIATVFIVILTVFLLLRTKPLNVPGPHHQPFIGALLEVFPNLPRFHLWIAECFNKYSNEKGTWGLTIPGQRMLFISNPENVKHVMLTNFDNYVKGPIAHDCFYELFHEGIFGTDGENWRKQRKAASHFFSARMMREKVQETGEYHVKVLVKILENFAEKKEMADLQELFFCLSTDVICDISFGKKMNTLHQPKNKFLASFDQANVICMQRMFFPIWKILKFFNLGSEKLMREYSQNIEEFLHQVVA